MKKPHKHNFKGRPDRACSTDDLRPTMNYIYIDEGCMIATNGYMLVKIQLSLSTIQGDLKLLDKCYIHRKQFTELLRYDTLFVSQDGQIKASKRIGRDEFSTIYQLKTDTNFERPFPDYKQVMNFEALEIGRIGISRFVMADLMSCFEGTCNIGQFEMKFQKPNQAIHFISKLDPEMQGILMPIMLNDYV